MQLIRIDNAKGPIVLTVAIEGLVVWRYKYIAEDYTYVEVSQPGSVRPPPQHALGMPAELNGDMHHWDVQLANLGGDDQDYSVKFSWTQEGSEVAEWTTSGTVRGDAPAESSGDAWIVGEG